MIIFKEYNYDLNTEKLISISMQKDPLVGGNIVYMKRDLQGRFIEKYLSSADGFVSTNNKEEITHSYTREMGYFEYMCNIKYTRMDGRVYYAQNPFVDASVFPMNDVIQRLLKRHNKIIELIYVEKDVGPQIYIIEEIGE